MVLDRMNSLHRTSVSVTAGASKIRCSRSCRRFKQHVKRVGKLPNGLPLYSFRYKWGGPTFVGVMAQDVLRVMPDAVVTDREGFYRVKYEMLGARMMTLPEWREQHPIAA